MKSVESMPVKLFHLLLVFSNLGPTIFCLLVKNPTSRNPPVPETTKEVPFSASTSPENVADETTTGVPSSVSTSPTNSAIEITKETTSNRVSSTEIIPTNGTIANITPQEKTAFAQTPKPPPKMIKSNFTETESKSITSVSSICKPNQTMTSDPTPKIIPNQQTNLTTSATQETATKNTVREKTTPNQTLELQKSTTSKPQIPKPTATSQITQTPVSGKNSTPATPASGLKTTPTSNKPPKFTKSRNKTKKSPCNTTRSKKKQKSPKTTPRPTSPKNKTTYKKQSHTYSYYQWTAVRTDPPPREIDYRESNEFGEESFKKFMIRTGIYVDKSLMIKEFLDHPNQIILITRPRFWGKSLNLNMLRKFFEIEVDPRGKILPREERTNLKIFCGGEISNGTAVKSLERLKIADVPEAMKHQGKHPVVQLNYNFIRNGSCAEMEIGMKMQIIRSFKRHFYLESYFKSNPLLLDHSQRPRFDRYCNGNLSDQDLRQSIRFMSELLYKYFNQTVFVLIDEYDAPLAEAFRKSPDNPKNLDNMLQFYRTLYFNGFENNPYLAKGFITGKLRIANSNLFPNLTNIAEYTLLDHQFNQFYGFTEQEMDQLLEHVPKETSDEIKSYYGGFNYGDQFVYNPWSIKQCIENGYKLGIYWLTTGILYPSNRKRYSLEGVQQDIKTLLSGGCIHIPIKNEVSFHGLENGTNFFNFILFTGYLSPVVKNPNGTYQLVKPNLEANRFYDFILGNWIEQHFRSHGRWGVTYPPGEQEDYDFSQIQSAEFSGIAGLLKKYAIVPDIIPRAPPKLAQVFFSWGELEPGASLHNNDTDIEPTLEWDAYEDSFYTLYLMTYNLRENTYVPEDSRMARYPTRPHFHNWIVINIPASNVSMGQVLYNYIPPRNPITYQDVNYCTFLIYKQAKGLIEFTPDEPEKPVWKDNSQYTPVVEFAANHSLGNPIFGNFFKMEFGSRIPAANKKTESNE